MLNDNSMQLLEFHKVLSLVAELCHGEASSALVMKTRPLTDLLEVRRRHGLCAEIMRLIQEGARLPMSQFIDIGPLLIRVRPQGSVLDPSELSAFRPVLEMAEGLASLCAERQDLPLLAEEASGLTGFPQILKKLNRSLDSDGNILDSASALLADLRAGIRKLEARIRRKLEDMSRAPELSVFLQDDFITTRSGRWVLPVRMDAKGQVPGVVHDVSKSGETAFIEPLGIIHTVNELENLIAEERAEEIRILKALSSEIREEAEALGAEYQAVVRLDAMNAVARFSHDLRMGLPEINETGILNVVSGRHPLLALSLKRSDLGREVIPLNASLSGQTRVMVITGSNAGGKTIAIKTIGLIVAMALSGMPIPADPSTSLPFVERLLIDIGDEQSIEQNLSTFSAHVSNISGILANAGPRTLVLIDELGTGTDPDEGAAIACAVLNELHEREAFVFATTHLTDIKGFVHRTPGMLNASMEFDEKTYTPLYRLRTGEPGRSHALEVARKYGLPDSVIDSARRLLGGVKVEFDNLIADLNSKRALYERRLEETEALRAELLAQEHSLALRLQEAEKQRHDIVTKAGEEALLLLGEARRRLHSTLDEIKRMDRERLRAELRELDRAQREAAGRLRSLESVASDQPPLDEIIEGDVVFVRSLGCDAEVIEINLKQGRVRVRAQNKEVEAPVEDLERKRGKKHITHEPALPENPGPDDSTGTRLMLLGLRVEEALSTLEPFLNHASLQGYSEVTIVHGVGTGALSRAVRGHLKGHQLVKSYRPGTQSEGGAGVTVALLV